MRVRPSKLRFYAFCNLGHKSHQLAFTASKTPFLAETMTSQSRVRACNYSMGANVHRLSWKTNFKLIWLLGLFIKLLENSQAGSGDRLGMIHQQKPWFGSKNFLWHFNVLGPLKLAKNWGFWTLKSHKFFWTLKSHNVICSNLNFKLT